MPHTGKPSGACQTCKQRHVKCDETRPACLKCIKANRVCPGFSEGLDLVLRDQNQVAKASAERRQKAHAKKRTCTSSSGSTSSEASSGLSSPSTSPTSSSEDDLIVYSSLAESRDSYAHAFFLSAYVLGPRDPRTDHGFLELLPLLFGRLPFDPVLSSSLAVLSHCYFGAWHRPIRNAETLTVRQSYSKALSGLRGALKDPRHCMSDEVLMSVCLLNFYEYTSNALASRPREDRHVDGATALVKQRGSRTMTSDLSKRLLIAVRHDMVAKALARSIPVDDAPEIWDDPDDMPYNPATSLDFIQRDSANLLAKAADYGSPASADSSDNNIHADIFLQAKALEARFSAWAEEVPAEWLPFSVPRHLIPHEVIDAGVLGDHCDIYSHTSVCATWNSWRVTRIRVLGLLADCERIESKQDVVLQIQGLGDDILASLPFMLGNKIEPSEMHDTDFVYPSIPGQDVPASHYQSAAAYGGLSLWVPMIAMLNYKQYMRVDQLRFSSQQFARLGRLYDVRNPN
ncbi:MAG: hypothetical protein Q9223_004096 [Gallowayella weberi]